MKKMLTLLLLALLMLAASSLVAQDKGTDPLALLGETPCSDQAA